MSTSSVPTPQRPYPLSPPPHNPIKQPQEVTFQHPRTPRSPSNPVSASSSRPSPLESSVPAVDQTYTLSENSVPKASYSRQNEGSALMDDTQMRSSMDVDDSSNKRKRDIEDTGDQEQKKVHVEDRRLGIEDLHLDVGKKYLLCRTPHPRIQPSLSQDLFKLYSLDDIADQVARTLPNGEKNKLRKTYKGKIKDLAISGKFDVVVRDDEDADGFLHMLRQPDEEWAIQNLQGKDVTNGLSTAVRANLAAAVTMSKGSVPKSSWDSSVLGELDFPETKAAVAPPTVKSLSAGAVQKGLNLPVSHPRNGKLEIARPKRNVKKRGYEESSFEGYGEGYVDDDMVDTGYSTAEGDDKGIPQKRRKKSATGHGYPGPMRHNSYGPGMVGA